MFQRDQEDLSRSINEHSRMDFKPPNHNEARGTARNCRKTKYTRRWTTMDHQRRSVIAETIQATLGSTLDQKENFQPIRDIFRPIGWTALATLKAKLFMRDLWKENWTWDEELPERKKRRMENNCRRFSNIFPKTLYIYRLQRKMAWTSSWIACSQPKSFQCKVCYRINSVFYYFG